MPAEADLLNFFRANGAKGLLSSHFVKARAGGMGQTYGGGGTIAALVGVGAALLADRAGGMNVDVTNNPPPLWAFFSYDGDPAPRIAASRQIFRRTVQVEFAGADAGGLGIEAYVLPSQGDGAIGIRLPAAGPVRYMFTTTQDGCTFQVSGDPISPFVSHTNVSSTAWGNKPAIINQRLQQLNDTFVPPGYRVVGNDPTVDVARLDYFDSNDPHGLGFVRAHAAQVLPAMGNLLDGSRGLAVREDNNWYSHDEIAWSLSQNTVNVLNNPKFMPNALVIGERAGANSPWKFYYQESMDMTLVRTTVRKIVAIPIGTSSATVTGRVIMAHGRLWPLPTKATFLPMY